MNLIGFIGVGSMAGRFVTGFLGDHFSPLLLYGLSVACIGLADVLLPFVEAYWMLAAIAIVRNENRPFSFFVSLLISVSACKTLIYQARLGTNAR